MATEAISSIYFSLYCFYRQYLPCKLRGHTHKFIMRPDAAHTKRFTVFFPFAYFVIADSTRSGGLKSRLRNSKKQKFPGAVRPRVPELSGVVIQISHHQDAAVVPNSVG